MYLCCLHTMQYPYHKAIGKDGILHHHEQSKIHCNATTQADIFTLSFSTPDLRIDSQCLKQQDDLAEENRTILRLMVTAVEFLQTRFTIQGSS